MRILIVTTFFPPMNSIASLRPHSWAKYWTLDKHEVTVLTTEKVDDPRTNSSMKNPGFQVIEIPLPHFFKKIKKSYISRNEVEVKNKVSSIKGFVLEAFEKFRRRRGIFAQCRMPDITDLWVRPAIKAVEDQKWDLIISSAGPYTTHLVAYHLKKHQHTKYWIADYRDLWTRNVYFRGLYPFTVCENFLEKKLLQRADAITTVSKPLVENMKKGFGIEKIFEIPNGFDLEDLNTLDKSLIFPQDQKFRILYTGSIYEGKQNIKPLFEAIRVMKNKTPNAALSQLEVIILTPQKNFIDRLIREFEVESFIYSKEMTVRNDALRMQRDSNLLLFLPWTDPDQKGIITGKIYEYLYSGTPILCVGATHEEESQKLIQDSNAGVSLNNIEQIVDFLEKNLNSPIKSRTQISEGFKLMYSRKELATKMLDICARKK